MKTFWNLFLRTIPNSELFTKEYRVKRALRGFLRVMIPGTIVFVGFALFDPSLWSTIWIVPVMGIVGFLILVWF